MRICSQKFIFGLKGNGILMIKDSANDFKFENYTWVDFRFRFISAYGTFTIQVKATFWFTFFIQMSSYGTSVEKNSG